MRRAWLVLALSLGALGPLATRRVRAQPVLPPPPPPPLDTSKPPPPPPPPPTATTPKQAPIDITVPKPRPKAATSNGAASAEPEPDSPVDLVGTKRRVDALDLNEKRELGYFTGLPLVNADPDTGIGFGARVYYFWNGRREDPLFAYTPYLHRVYAQAFFTTNGYQYHTVDYDGLYLGRSPYRLRAGVVYEKNIAANYFGRGTSTLGALAFPGASGSYSSMSEYTDATGAIQPGGATYARYDRYILTRPVARASVERDLSGGVVRVLGGASVSYVTIRDYSGLNVTTSNGTKAPEADTRLRTDCNSGAIIGCQDGWNNQLKLGIAYDTRDFEPDPTSGVFADLTTEISSKAFGSRYDYGRVTAAPRFFVSALHAAPPARLTLAARGVYSISFGDVPFFDMGTLAFTDIDQQGLGGLRTIRGFKQERFVGKVAALANLEVRWTFAEARLRKQRFHFMLVPFLDIGRVFDDVGGTTLAGWKRGQGAALRVGWNQATIVSFDYGVSTEGGALYVNFGHPF